MRNHQNRSCAVAHRTLYAVQMASAKIDDLAAAYVVAEAAARGPDVDFMDTLHQRTEPVRATLMIEQIGAYRFGEHWPRAVELALLPPNSQIVERGRVA